MDTTTAAVIVIAIFAVIIAVAFLRYRKSGEAEIKGPFGTALSVKCSSMPSSRKFTGNCVNRGRAGFEFRCFNHPN